MISPAWVDSRAKLHSILLLIMKKIKLLLESNIYSQLTHVSYINFQAYCVAVPNILHTDLYLVLCCISYSDCHLVRLSCAYQEICGQYVGVRTFNFLVISSLLSPKFTNTCFFIVRFPQVGLTNLNWITLEHYKNNKKLTLRKVSIS